MANCRRIHRLIKMRSATGLISPSAQLCRKAQALITLSSRSAWLRFSYRSAPAADGCRIFPGKVVSVNQFILHVVVDTVSDPPIAVTFFIFVAVASVLVPHDF